MCKNGPSDLGETNVKPIGKKRQINKNKRKSAVSINGLSDLGETNLRPMCDQCKTNVRPMRNQRETNVSPR